MNILVTGGAGFIGSALVRHLIEHTSATVINVDKLTYAGNPASLAAVESSGRYRFEHADICDRPPLDDVFLRHQPHAVMHLAAESHVDRSIDGPADFVQTNLMGTYQLLEAARAYWAGLSKPDAFRFLHVSTDEVFGDLGDTGSASSETCAYVPSSPYAATKAGADHLVRAWARTYGLPALITNCSNNYGPYQFPEKLVPHTILNALAGRPLPVYGDGSQVRDWLFVDDHARALCAVLERGAVGETYNVGARSERRNLDVVRAICHCLDSVLPDRAPFEELITFVEDRPGHDRRYAIDPGKLEQELGWAPAETFDSGLAKTVRWYLDNETWWRPLLDHRYELDRRGLSGASR